MAVLHNCITLHIPLNTKKSTFINPIQQKNLIIHTTSYLILKHSKIVFYLTIMSHCVRCVGKCGDFCRKKIKNGAQVNYNVYGRIYANY